SKSSDDSSLDRLCELRRTRTRRLEHDVAAVEQRTDIVEAQFFDHLAQIRHRDSFGTTNVYASDQGDTFRHGCLGCIRLLCATMNVLLHHDQVELRTRDIIRSHLNLSKSEFPIERPTFRVLLLDVKAETTCLR